MSISRVLLKNQLDRIFSELEQVQEETSKDISPETAEIKDLIIRKSRQLEGLKAALNSEESASFIDLQDLAQAFHQIRLEMRLARRRWKRVMTTEARFRKMQIRRQFDVPNFAA